MTDNEFMESQGNPETNYVAALQIYRHTNDVQRKERTLAEQDSELLFSLPSFKLQGPFQSHVRPYVRMYVCIYMCMLMTSSQKVCFKPHKT